MWVPGILLCLCIGQPVFAVPVPHPYEEEPSFWRAKGHAELQKALENEPIVGVAKNVILFLGDGMGITTVTAARILAGQLKGQTGEEGSLSFDRFPHVAFSKTYNVDHQTTDSSASATAYLCGVKTRNGIIGLDAHAEDCATSQGHEVTSILHWSKDAGKSTGVVTTAMVTHATPAASYAHSPSRGWMTNVPHDQRPCKDIGYQLVHENDINVVLGGGRASFLPENAVDPEWGTELAQGREDGRNLIDDWMAIQSSKGRRYKYVWNQTAFDTVDPNNTDYLLGLFEPDHMQYEIARHDDKAGEPSLAEMTRKAIEILRKNSKGFFLLVEGGKIDMGHHYLHPQKALTDTIAFSEAVGVAADTLDPRDTLIIVTADHSHGMTFAGINKRGNPILGLASDGDEPALATDDKPFTALVYGVGPGYHTPRRDPTQHDISSPHYRYHTAVPGGIETHAGEDVGIYARGPMAHLFHGVHEESYIAYVMAYASCVGEFSDPEDCAAAKSQKTSAFDFDKLKHVLQLLATNRRTPRASHE